MSNLLRKASMLTGMVIASGSMMLATAPSYAGNEIQMEAVADVIPACDIVGQTVGRLVESVPGDGGDIAGSAFTRGRLVSNPSQTADGGFDTTAARGQLAYVGLSCSADADIIATITSPVQISGTALDINVATTSMYAPRQALSAANVITDTLASINSDFLNANPVALATSGANGAVATSDAALILGAGAASASPTGTFGFGFNIEVNGERIPAGQYGIASTLTVVPR